MFTFESCRLLWWRSIVVCPKAAATNSVIPCGFPWEAELLLVPVKPLETIKSMLCCTSILVSYCTWQSHRLIESQNCPGWKTLSRSPSPITICLHELRCQTMSSTTTSRHLSITSMGTPLQCLTAPTTLKPNLPWQNPRPICPAHHILPGRFLKTGSLLVFLWEVRAVTALSVQRTESWASRVPSSDALSEWALVHKTGLLLLLGPKQSHLLFNIIEVRPPSCKCNRKCLLSLESCLIGCCSCSSSRICIKERPAILGTPYPNLLF